MALTQPRYFGNDITNHQTYPDRNVMVKQKLYKVSGPTVNSKKENQDNIDDFDPDFVLKTDNKLCKVDLEFKNDELYNTHYIKEQFTHLFETESCTTDYILSSSLQSIEEFVITEKHRALMINYAILFNDTFEMYDETLFCAVKIIDRYLAKENGKLLASKRILNNYKDEMALIASCALWSSSKYHEIYPPAPEDFLQLDPNNFDEDDLINMETMIIPTISYDLTVSNSLIFIQRFYQFGCYYIDQNPKVKETKQKQKQKDILLSLMKYCGEISFMDYRLSLQKPSEIAAAILYYSCVGTGIFSWTQIQNDDLVQYINNYEMSGLLNIIQTIHKIAIGLEKKRNSLIYKKYSHIDAFCVTKIPCKMYGPKKQQRQQ